MSSLGASGAQAANSSTAAHTAQELRLAIIASICEILGPHLQRDLVDLPILHDQPDRLHLLTSGLRGEQTLLAPDHRHILERVAADDQDVGAAGEVNFRTPGRFVSRSGLGGVAGAGSVSGAGRSAFWQVAVDSS